MTIFLQNVILYIVDQYSGNLRGPGSFIIGENVMSKEFKTIEEQIDILKSRSLIVNETEAKIIFSKNRWSFCL